jgi:predicted CXXCH cytochrome family protein
MKSRIFSTLFTNRRRLFTVLLAIGNTAIMLMPATVVGSGAVIDKGGVFGSPHNLSASGSFGVRFSEEQRVCIFCHTPHNSTTSQPLWGRELTPGSDYKKPYESTTLKALPKPDKPTGASRLCLSCHDGTIALNQFVGSAISASQKMPSTSSNPLKSPTLFNSPNLKTDLNDDHPISFMYDDALVTRQGQLLNPGLLPQEIRLESGLFLQCTACHDPHNNKNGNFLVLDNSAAGSPLCVACHKNTGWSASSHYPLAGGCMSCHYVHNAPGPERLLHSASQVDNCYLSCHNGAGSPGLDVKSLFSTLKSRHPVDQESLFVAPHDESPLVESLPATSYHVECVDCHNPHQVNAGNSPLSNPPATNGPLAGVRIDNLGGVATREYEVCFKCHSGGKAADFITWVTSDKPNRMINEPDQKNRFDPVNTSSYHPVIGLRKGSGASLLTTLQSSMLRIYCSDCHNSNNSKKAGRTGANGPHGSDFKHILMKEYDMPLPAESHPPYSTSQYDICYSCHSDTYIMGSSSGFKSAGINEHSRHVIDRKTPCFVCHDPHGVPGPSGINTHLVNFNKDYTANGTVPLYLTTGAGSGSCKVSCHTNSGNTRSYP